MFQEISEDLRASEELQVAKEARTSTIVLSTFLLGALRAVHWFKISMIVQINGNWDADNGSDADNFSCHRDFYDIKNLVHSFAISWKRCEWNTKKGARCLM